MTYYNPPHEVKDEAKLQSMIDALNNGKQLPPVIVYGNNAYTGSHRLAAWETCEMEAQVVELSEPDLITALAAMNGIDDLDINDPDDIEFFNEHIGYDVYDYNKFCEALLRVSKDESIRKAAEDQI